MTSTVVFISLLGVLIAFAAIVLMIRKRYNFGLSLIFGSGLVAVFSLAVSSPESIGKAVILALIYDVDTASFQLQTIELAVLMTLIYMLASLMQDTGGIAKLIRSLRSFFSQGGTLGLIPAIYGLMPVPGGALFSAAIVDEEGEKFGLKTNEKNYFNIWFRHIWFPVYPISSTILIMADLSSINMYQLILANGVAFFAMILIGFVFLKRIIKPWKLKNKDDKQKMNRDWKGFVYLLPPVIPLGFSVLTYTGFIDLFPAFIIGVIVSIGILYVLSDVDVSQYTLFCKNALTWKLAAVIIGIMLFREIFSVSGANQAIFSLLQLLPVPILLIIIVFPFVLGVLTGYLLSGITLSYILVEPWFDMMNMDIVGIVSILFMSGFIGYLISPIHLCNVLSSEYLKTDTTRMYNLLIPSAIVLLFIHIIFVILFY